MTPCGVLQRPVPRRCIPMTDTSASPMGARSRFERTLYKGMKDHAHKILIGRYLKKKRLARCCRCFSCCCGSALSCAHLCHCICPVQALLPQRLPVLDKASNTALNGNKGEPYAKREDRHVEHALLEAYFHQQFLWLCIIRRCGEVGILVDQPH
jgi:hypothetical protein